jgi:hypothetical protein
LLEDLFPFVASDGRERASVHVTDALMVEVESGNDALSDWTRSEKPNFIVWITVSLRVLDRSGFGFGSNQ